MKKALNNLKKIHQTQKSVLHSYFRITMLHCYPKMSLAVLNKLELSLYFQVHYFHHKVSKLYLLKTDQVHHHYLSYLKQNFALLNIIDLLSMIGSINMIGLKKIQFLLIKLKVQFRDRIFFYIQKRQYALSLDFVHY